MATKKKKKQRWTFVVVVVCLLLLIFIFGMKAFRNEKEQVNDVNAFIETLAPEAEKLQQQYHVPASITLAQAILESDFGKSELSAKYHNLFGVKASLWQPHVTLETKEYEDGVWKTIKARFRVYSSWNASLKDHARLIAQGTDSNARQYEAVLRANNYYEAAQALQDGGYATDPAYANKLINVIETYHLDRFDAQ